MICRILDTSISSFLLDRNILSHPWHLHFFVSTRPEYSIASSTIPFLCIYSTRIFYRILDTSISSHLFDQNNISHHRQIHFFVSTRPEYSIGSSTPPFLCTFSTRTFYRILENSISLYLLDRNIPLHPRHLLFFVSTRPEYSIATSTNPFLRIYSTRIFYRILDTSIFSHLLDRSILSHPWHLHFYGSTRPKYSITSSTPPFLCTYSTRIFYRILDTSISTYLIDHNILSYPWHINFYISTWPEYSIASSTTTFLRIYSTRIFRRILDTSISSHLLDQNILSYPQHLNFFVSTRPE